MTQPYGAPPTPPAPSSGAAPQPVENAFRLMIARAVLGVIGILLVFAQKDEIRKAVIKSNTTVSPQRIDELVNAAVGVAVVLGLIFTVLYVLLAVQVRNGKSWARIVTYVLAGLGILGGLAGFASSTATGAAKLIGAVTLVINVVIVVMLSKAESTAWFNRGKAQTYQGY